MSAMVDWSQHRVGKVISMEYESMESDEEKDDQFLHLETRRAEERERAKARAAVEYGDEELLLAAAPSKRRALALPAALCLCGMYAAVPLARAATSAYAAEAQLLETSWASRCYDAAVAGCRAGLDAPALDGADVVAYFAEDAHRQGSAAFSAAHEGVPYWFASAANRDAFVASPEAYAPRLGGFCAYALTGADAEGSVCELALDTVDPAVFYVHDDRLYLFKGRGAKNNMDVEADLVAAEAHWAALAAAEGLGSFVNSDSDACVDVVAAQMASLTAGAWSGGGNWRSAS